MVWAAAAMLAAVQWCHNMQPCITTHTGDVYPLRPKNHQRRAIVRAAQVVLNAPERPTCG